MHRPNCTSTLGLFTAVILVLFGCGRLGFNGVSGATGSDAGDLDSGSVDARTEMDSGALDGESSDAPLDASPEPLEPIFDWGTWFPNLLNGPLCADGSGNLYLHANLADAAEPTDLGGEPIDGTGLSPGVLASFNASGELRWTRMTNGVSASDLACGAATAGVFILGSHREEVRLEGSATVIPPTVLGGGDGLIVKYDTRGAFGWHKTLSSPLLDRAIDGAVDAAGNLYVAGRIGGAIDFGGEWVDPTAPKSFLASYNETGGLRYARAVPGWSARLALTPDGTAYVAGESRRGIVDFGTGEIELTMRGMFFARYLPTGGLQWVEFHDSPSGLSIESVAVAPGGESYVIGEFEEEIDFDGELLMGDSKKTGYIVSFDPDGRHRWSRAVTESSDFFLFSEAIVGRDGNLYTLASMRGSADFGDGLLPVPDAESVMIASYRRDGAFRWSYHFGPRLSADDGALAIDSDLRLVFFAKVFPGVEVGEFPRDRH